jgi:hypothetical protein
MNQMGLKNGPLIMSAVQQQFLLLRNLKTSIFANPVTAAMTASDLRWLSLFSNHC